MLNRTGGQFIFSKILIKSRNRFRKSAKLPLTSGYYFGKINATFVFFCFSPVEILRWPMQVNYRKLWIMCAEKEISPAELRKKAGLAPATFTKLRKNQEVNLSVLLRIADVLNCNAGEMMDFLPDDQVLGEVDVESVW